MGNREWGIGKRAFSKKLRYSPLNNFELRNPVCMKKPGFWDTAPAPFPLILP
jgi:hypothetical protein